MRFLRFQPKLGHVVSHCQCIKIYPKLPKTAQKFPKKNITFLNKAGMTVSCRGSKKILAHDTCKSLEFNLDVGSIILCLVLQLFMLELMAAWCLPATTWI
jgi:hypothetical protein